MRTWWLVDPAGVKLCDIRDCRCPVQRTPRGTLADGMTAHMRVVHSQRAVSAIPAIAGASS